MTAHFPSAPINTERTSEANASRIGELNDQIDRLTSENDELQEEITGQRSERDQAREERDELQCRLDKCSDALKGR